MLFPTNHRHLFSAVCALQLAALLTLLQQHHHVSALKLAPLQQQYNRHHQHHHHHSRLLSLSSTMPSVSMCINDNSNCNGKNMSKIGRIMQPKGQLFASSSHRSSAKLGANSRRLLTSFMQSPSLNGAGAGAARRSVLKSAVMDELAVQSAGPVLNTKKRAAVSEFVDKMAGKRVIQRVLVANNGMAATKAILSMRHWAYMNLGDERAIEFVALATRDDLNANAEFIKLADTYVEVPSGSNKNNYANVDLIVDIAVAQKVDAVWPGWGHASENPKLPSQLKARGIQFIGPTAPVMAALGDKISANILAQTAKVPSIPWSGGGITCELNEEGVIPEATFLQACVSSADEAAIKADEIGYPVMIKASEGGGGKGIRMVQNPEDLKTNFIQVQNEVPGSPIFMMQLCTQARHLEVQIVGDEYGNAVALNGRDCSTQRRFQKIFEEGPPNIAPKDTFREMERSAQRLTKSIGYIGAGTVEYLYNAASDSYYFLELNPRLQVEHPVTEGLTGINLPSVQLQVAMGISLDKIPEIRKFYGKNPDYTKDDKAATVKDGEPLIDFMNEDYMYPDNHVIAARITAENPDEGFKPTSGKIERVKFQSTNKVWGYFSVGANGGIHEFADSQFGHLFASGPTREDARKSLVLALKEIDVRGDIRTTVEYLIKLLETPEFKDNTIDTSWLDGIIREKAVAVLVDAETVALTAAVYKAHAFVGAQKSGFLESLRKGQTSLQAISGMLNFPVEITYDNVKYPFTARSLGPDYYALTINGQEIAVRIREQPDNSLLCTIAGESYQLYGQEEALGLRMKINGATVMIPTVYNPSELRSDVTGKIVRFLQQDRESVEKDEPYVEVEAMKMIMSLKASESGIIQHSLSPGSIISAGDMIASLALKDPSKVKQISTFSGNLSKIPRPSLLTKEEAMEAIELAVDGYGHNVDEAMGVFMASSSLAEVQAFFAAQLNRFLQVESLFLASEEASIVSDLVKANKEKDETTGKDKLEGIVPTLLARRQLQSRASVIMSVLRRLEILPQQFVEYAPNENMAEELGTALTNLSALSGRSGYGEVSLKSKQIVDSAAEPPFLARLEALKEQLRASSADLNALSKQPNIAVSVDLLVVLMSDDEATVRKAALEVYIRRVYRAHCIKSLSIQETETTTTTQTPPTLSASWSFTLRDLAEGETPVRYGYMHMLPDFDGMNKAMPSIIKSARESFAASQAEVQQIGTFNEPLNVLHIGFSRHSAEQKEEQLAALAQESIAQFKSEMKLLDCRSVNVLMVNTLDRKSKRVTYFNFYSSADFAEDPISRNMRPTMPLLLELNRLTENHDLIKLPTVGRNGQLYLGKEKLPPGTPKGGRAAQQQQQVLFLRSISLSSASVEPQGAERIMVIAMDEIERAMLDPQVSPTASSRLFVNVLPEIQVDVTECTTRFKAIMSAMVAKYATRLLKLRVDEIEVKIRVRDENGAAVPIRLIASSSTGGWLTREAYREYLDPITGQTTQYCTLASDDREMVCVLDPYPTSTVLQKKRAVARRVGSTYATDFLGLLEVALINTWQRYIEESLQSTAEGGSAAVSMQAVDDLAATAIPPLLLTFDELVMENDDPKNPLTISRRFPGNNKIGMLAWHTTMKTPQYPEGREVVLIANDVTVQSGSFGVLEDEFFFKASEYARVRGLPRIFLSCNSGARIGLVDELKPKFKVAWKDENVPTLGFDYLYLTEDDYSALAPGTVDATPLTDTSFQGTRYVLDAIIGQKNGIGVENLRGSGMIAGETSRAYDETFTLSYVTGRSVGIGAYLNRLGQRVIQMQQGPMILTGFSALNKLLGKEVYTSQDQLGGPQIMYPNGVTHEVVPNDREGMQSIIDWLSYTPKDFHSVAPRMAALIPGKSATPFANSSPLSANFLDPIDREVGFVPSKSAPYDPRHMLAGVKQPDGTFLSGFFDKGSFKEYLGGWGKSVVTGRARLGGVNVGVIAVETRLVEQKIPADPGNPESRESIQPQAGQVWYPDSAFKTAQAIEDFNRGENLPLIIFANWRGFSGGTRDMYGEILKYGAMIVDALRNYKHPVFVYIPPGGELRGGAWVVIDPTINEQKMEMFADKDSRGGILEPPGICEVKFRAPEQVLAMQRLDPQIAELNDALENAQSEDERAAIQSDVKAREKTLLPLYTQIAHEFADLHDRAGRMKAKGCISEVLEWKTARAFFYWRILRRQAEDSVKEKIVTDSKGALSPVQARDILSGLMAESGAATGSDEQVVAWLSSDEGKVAVEKELHALRVKHARQNIHSLLQDLSAEEKKEVLDIIHGKKE